MTKTLLVRDVEDDLVLRLERRAARHGRSTEAEHLDILRQALESDAPVDFFALAAQVRALTKDRVHTPSEVLQREGRDER